MNPGWIKLHRKLLEWEWYTDANTLRLFLHLLLEANYETRRWRGHVIQPGQLVVGRKKLSAELKLSEQQIRTSLDRLKSTNEITIQSTKEYSLITICKWEDYQSMIMPEQPTNQPAKQPTNNQRSTTTKEDKEREEYKNNIPADFVAFFEMYPGNKKSVQTEYQNFKKKNSQDILPHLLPGLNKEIKHREFLKSQKSFVPTWKYMTTWINTRCWEQEFSSSDEQLNTDGRPPRPSPNHKWSEKQQKWTIL